MAKSALTMTVSGYRELMNDLRKIEPDLNTAMRRDIRKIGNPIRNAIRSNIPKTAPIKKPVRPGQGGGMTTRVGRLSWGANVMANKTVLDTSKPSRKSKNGISLVKIRVSSPATVMADMMGKSGRYIGQKPYAAGTKSNTYAYTTNDGRVIFGYKYTYHTKKGEVIGGRKHRNTGRQGLGLIRALGAHPSRFVYPAAEKSLPVARYEISKIVDRYIAIANQGKR